MTSSSKTTQHQGYIVRRPCCSNTSSYFVSRSSICTLNGAKHFYDLFPETKLKFWQKYCFDKWSTYSREQCCHEYSNNWAQIIVFVFIFTEFSNSEYYSNIQIIDPNSTNNFIIIRIIFIIICLFAVIIPKNCWIFVSISNCCPI